MAGFWITRAPALALLFLCGHQISGSGATAIEVASCFPLLSEGDVAGSTAPTRIAAGAFVSAGSTRSAKTTLLPTVRVSLGCAGCQWRRDDGEGLLADGSIDAHVRNYWYDDSDDPIGSAADEAIGQLGPVDHSAAFAKLVGTHWRLEQCHVVLPSLSEEPSASSSSAVAECSFAAVPASVAPYFSNLRLELEVTADGRAIVSSSGNHCSVVTADSYVSLGTVLIAPSIPTSSQGEGGPDASSSSNGGGSLNAAVTGAVASGSVLFLLLGDGTALEVQILTLLMQAPSASSWDSGVTSLLSYFLAPLAGVGSNLIAVLGNVMIAAFVTMIHFGFVFRFRFGLCSGVSRRTLSRGRREEEEEAARPSWHVAMGRFYFPAVTMITLEALYAGVVQNTIQAIFNNDKSSADDGTKSEVVLCAVIGIAYAIGAPLLVQLLTRRLVIGASMEYTTHPPELFNKWGRFFLPRGVWGPTLEVNRMSVGTYGQFHGKGNARFFAYMPFAVTTLTSIFVEALPKSLGNIAPPALVLVLCLVCCVAIVARVPHRSVLTTVLSAGAFGALVMVCATQIASNSGTVEHHAVEFIGMILVALFSLLRSLHGFYLLRFEVLDPLEKFNIDECDESDMIDANDLEAVRAHFTQQQGGQQQSQPPLGRSPRNGGGRSGLYNNAAGGTSIISNSLGGNASSFYAATSMDEGSQRRIYSFADLSIRSTSGAATARGRNVALMGVGEGSSTTNSPTAVQQQQQRPPGNASVIRIPSGEGAATANTITTPAAAARPSGTTRDFWNAVVQDAEEVESVAPADDEERRGDVESDAEGGGEVMVLEIQDNDSNGGPSPASPDCLLGGVNSGGRGAKQRPQLDRLCAPSALPCDHHRHQRRPPSSAATLAPGDQRRPRTPMSPYLVGEVVVNPQHQHQQQRVGGGIHYSPVEQFHPIRGGEGAAAAADGRIAARDPSSISRNSGDADSGAGSPWWSRERSHTPPYRTPSGAAESPLSPPAARAEGSSPNPFNIPSTSREGSMM